MAKKQFGVEKKFLSQNVQVAGGGWAIIHFNTPDDMVLGDFDHNISKTRICSHYHSIAAVDADLEPKSENQNSKY